MLGHMAGGLRSGGNKAWVCTNVNVVLSLDRGLQMWKALDVTVEVTKNELRSTWLDIELSKDRPKEIITSCRCNAIWDAT